MVCMLVFTVACFLVENTDSTLQPDYPSMTLEGEESKEVNTIEDQNGEKGTTAEINNNEPNSSNIIDKSKVKIGDVILGLTVKSLDLSEGHLNDITFSGEIEISGTYEWVTDFGDGSAFIFTVDEASFAKLPILEGLIMNTRTIVISNTEFAKEAFTGNTGSAQIVIDNFSVGERQILLGADMIRILTEDGITVN